jgi:outer membrane protein assembly factor BamD (BamD/ComL family)
MTLEQAKEQIAAIHARTDIGPAQKAAMVFRVQAQARRANPEMAIDELQG